MCGVFLHRQGSRPGGFSDHQSLNAQHNRLDMSIAMHSDVQSIE